MAALTVFRVTCNSPSSEGAPRAKVTFSSQCLNSVPERSPRRPRIGGQVRAAAINAPCSLKPLSLPKQIDFTVYLFICYWSDMPTAQDHEQVMLASVLAQDLRALLGKLRRRLREQARIGDLTPSQVSVLHRIEKHGPATVSNLARVEGMRPQSMAPIIAELESAGLVNGAPDPADGRQTLLSLTDAGRKWIAAGRAARQDWLTRTLQARLSPQEQDRLAKAVVLLRRLVDD